MIGRSQQTYSSINIARCTIRLSLASQGPGHQINSVQIFTANALMYRFYLKAAHVYLYIWCEAIPAHNATPSDTHVDVGGCFSTKIESSYS